MPTIRDVAKRAGVSVATVSRVINDSEKVSDKTSRRVKRSIAALGFEPDFLARTWRTRVTHTIAAVVVDNTGPHHGIALREASAVALAHNYTLILCTTYFNPQIEKQYLRMLRERRVDGVLLNTVGQSKDEIRALTKSGIPVVMLNRPLADYGPLVDAVVVDSYRGARELVEHLVRVGHQRIAMTYDQALSEFHQRERLRGYRDALRANNLPYREELVCAIRLNHASGSDCFQEQLTFSPRPTAIFAAGYGTGLATLALLRAQGLRIPTDIAFAMFDDVPWGEFMDPPLTTVVNPAQDLGRRAIELIFARLADRKRPPQEIRLEPQLIVRRSCGAPNLGGPVSSESTPSANSSIMLPPAQSSHTEVAKNLLGLAERGKPI
jgi:LacI family transcriptional regulator